MSNGVVDLARYSVAEFDRGASRVKEALWVLVSFCLFRLVPLKLSRFKSVVLRCFGAEIGEGVVIKPNVTITFPWKLTIADHVWLGEECWLLNLAPIKIENNVCVSQRAFLCTGSHDYKSLGFDLIVKPIILERGAWVGSGAWVGPGVRVGSHAVLAANSVTAKDLESFGIYQGNPAVLVRRRTINATMSNNHGAH